MRSTTVLGSHSWSELRLVESTRGGRQRLADGGVSRGGHLSQDEGQVTQTEEPEVEEEEQLTIFPRARWTRTSGAVLTTTWRISERRSCSQERAAFLEHVPDLR